MSKKVNFSSLNPETATRLLLDLISGTDLLYHASMRVSTPLDFSSNLSVALFHLRRAFVILKDGSSACPDMSYTQFLRCLFDGVRLGKKL